MNKYSRLGKNTGLIIVGNIGSRFISFFMLPFYTTWLSVKDYGIIDLIQVYTSFILSIISCCIYESIFVFPKGQKKEKQTTYFSSGIYYTILLFAITGILSFIFHFILVNNHVKNFYTTYSLYLYIIIFLSFTQTYTQQFSRSLNQMNIYALCGIIYTASMAISSIILLPIYGVYGFLIAQIVSLAISTIYTFLFGKMYKFINWSYIQKREYIEMLKYALPLIPNALIWWLILSFNRPVIESYIGLKAVGLFAVACKLPNMIGAFYNMFGTSWQISVLEEFNNSDYTYFFNRVCRFIVLGLVFISSLMCITSKWIISLLTSVEFIDAWIYIPILSLAILFSNISNFIGATFSAVKQSKYYFYSGIWGAISSIVFNFTLIPTYGLYGAAISMVLANFIILISRTIYSWKYVKIQNLFSYVIMIGINIIIAISVCIIDNLLIKSISIVIFLSILILANKSVIRDLYNNLILHFNQNKKQIQNESIQKNFKE
ncbi:lipopolysaccharide biosynthesis protein [Parabacteroides faecis]|uniref:O-antigen/teichoic acid export membrane protein n=1 Tax=Parabacteroides faecis TaxID=1217282 RepID=A0ABR6KHZ4_9BACT|nr:polysaccharide biosynthesis C-terminal domain-containing protein [Parabacteroides faecis]MBB4621126.1 O-antigen/teichoic acid export membrane protein [Parabacteroides faecis]GGJ88991.1 polysaccharide biosynthesis protein [Parabacteroides faecis]